MSRKTQVPVSWKKRVQLIGDKKRWAIFDSKENKVLEHFTFSINADNFCRENKNLKVVLCTLKEAIAGLK